MEDFLYLNDDIMFDPLSIEGKELEVTNDCINLVFQINEKIDHVRMLGHEPEFILLNKRNYERLVTHEKGLIDEFNGIKVVLWDVPVDYVNIRAKASVEFAYEGNLRNGE
ncbi:hypothetical protein [Paenibacillus illinoisensis]|uniref:hypothetical protein n=1 Tax=Paenibacillus illinoisensis TaxID=59845 RepID=UPI00301A6555